MTVKAPKKPQQRSRSKSSVGAVEIKVTVKPDQELQALRALELNEDSAEVRVIYFFDTLRLDLFNSGIALRARLVKGDKDDSTVKFRPVKPEKISDEWKKLSGFKLEADCVGPRVVCSASHTIPQHRGEIVDVAKGERPIKSLFSKDQERFLGAFFKGSVNYKNVRVLGPIRVLRWKLKHKGFPYELTAEEWRLPDGEDLVEASIKVPPGKAQSAQKAFEKHLRKIGLDPAGAQQTKTRTALEYFAKNYRKAKKTVG